MKIERTHTSPSLFFDVDLFVSGWEPTADFNEGGEWVTNATGDRTWQQKSSKRKFQVTKIAVGISATYLEEGDKPDLSLNLMGHWAKKDGRGWFVDSATVYRYDFDKLPPVFARAIVEQIREQSIQLAARCAMITDVCKNTLGEAA
jgi:hypothetical protein